MQAYGPGEVKGLRALGRCWEQAYGLAHMLEGLRALKRRVIV
jgi:hypothetical protein